MKILIFCIGLFFASCGDSGQGGVVNDGIETVDSNGALIDSTPGQPWDPSVDTSLGENRVDLQQRGRYVNPVKQKDSL